MGKAGDAGGGDGNCDASKDGERGIEAHPEALSEVEGGDGAGETAAPAAAIGHGVGVGFAPAVDIDGINGSCIGQKRTHLGKRAGRDCDKQLNRHQKYGMTSPATGHDCGRYALPEGPAFWRGLPISAPLFGSGYAAELNAPALCVEETVIRYSLM
jgi:hypothetical protein